MERRHRKKKVRKLVVECEDGTVVVRAPAGCNRLTLPEAHQFLFRLGRAALEAEAAERRTLLANAAELPG